MVGNFDKRADFNFLIVNFPFICSNIPTSPAYGDNVSHLIRHSRSCGSYHHFLDRGLLSQGFLLATLKVSIRRFYGRQRDLVNRYELPVSYMTMDLSSPPVFSEVRVTRSLVLCVWFVDRCLSFFLLFHLSLCCLFFFDIRNLTTPLLSSNSSSPRKEGWVHKTCYRSSCTNHEGERSCTMYMLVVDILVLITL